MLKNFVVLLVACSFTEAAHFGAFKKDAFIIGGTEVDIKDYPYQVSLIEDGHHICGGAIITRHHILCAAHCTVYPGYFLGEPYKNTFQVRLGSSSRTSGGRILDIEAVFNHPDYVPLGTVTELITSNDISVLKVAGIIEFSDTIQRIPMAKFNDVIEFDKVGKISGWGTYNYTKTGDDNLVHLGPEMLQAVDMCTYPNEYCNENYNAQLTEDQICLMSDGTSGSCSGDSGGPFKRTSDQVLVGITSLGFLDVEGRCDQTLPSVYTRVAYFRKWIKSITGSSMIGH